MNKFLCLFFALIFISCSNESTNPEGGSSGNTTVGGNPSWYLTDEEQKTPRMIHQTTLGQTVGKSQYYRIPAVAVTPKGTLVVAFDNRKTKNADVGFGNSDGIEPTVRRSEDGGRTWSQNIRVGRPASDNTKSNGDPVLFVTKSGKIVILAASGGAWAQGNGIRESHITMSKSTDDGKTWTDWKRVDNNILVNGGELYKKGYSKGFVASGRGTTMANGTLVCTLLVGDSTGYTKKAAYTYYSTDEGETWKVGGFIEYTGSPLQDEPKIIAELADGSLLMSARPGSAGRARLWAIASSVTANYIENTSYGIDGTTGQSIIDGRANAEGVRYTLIKNGHKKNRILFLNSNSSTERRELTIFLSDDDGKRFYTKKVVQSGRACYSSIDVLPDGTIVTFAEEPSTATELDNYDLVFRRFNLAWVTDGNEVYSKNW